MKEKLFFAAIAALLIFLAAELPAEASSGASPSTLGIVGLVAGVAVVTVALKKMMH